MLFYVTGLSIPITSGHWFVGLQNNFLGNDVSQSSTSNKICILLMDANPERRALRTKIMALHGVEVVAAGDLTEAAFVWDRDRYDLVLIDIRRDYRGCLAFRDEIKKEKPEQIVAFLVGRPHYVDLAPLEDSYQAEKPGMDWGDSLRLAVRQSCEALPQRNGLAEAISRISAAKKISAAGTVLASAKSAKHGSDIRTAANHETGAPSLRSPNAETIFASAVEEGGVTIRRDHQSQMETE